MFDIVEEDLKLIWHPYTQAKIAERPIAIEKAAGAYLYTTDGHKVFDGISSWWVNLLGHSEPNIAAAIAKQANILEQVIFANFTHEPAVKLAKMLIDMAPAGFSRVFYSDNGSTAVEVALKMAYQYWQNRGEHRPYFIALEHSYHGDTFGAMSASERSIFTKAFWPMLFKVLRSKSTCVSEINSANTPESITKEALAPLEKLICEDPNKIAGIIIEPMLQGAGGMRIFTPGFLRGIKELCQKYNILLIADEIATGFYRTGKLFACEHEQVVPDIMCLAKGLTGGFLPLAVTLTSEKIFEAFLDDSKEKALLHGHSFCANPLGCAAAITSLELLQKESTQENIRAITQTINKSINNFDGISSIANIRSIGTIIAIELKSEQAGYLSNIGAQISKRCFEQGLFIRPLGNVIYLMPPLCATPDEISWALGKLCTILTQAV